MEQTLQPGIDHFLSVEGLKQNLDVVVKGKSNIGKNSAGWD